MDPLLRDIFCFAHLIQGLLLQESFDFDEGEVVEFHLVADAYVLVISFGFGFDLNFFDGGEVFFDDVGKG